MSLFRQQALEQRRLPDPLFTPVAIVIVRRWLGMGALLSLIGMVVVWLLFGTVYTTYESSVTMTGAQTLVTLPDAVEVSTDALHPTHFIGRCPEAIQGIIRLQDGQNHTLLLEQPIQADCQITLLLREERPLERLFR